MMFNIKKRSLIIIIILMSLVFSSCGNNGNTPAEEITSDLTSSNSEILISEIAPVTEPAVLSTEEIIQESTSNTTEENTTEPKSETPISEIITIPATEPELSTEEIVQTFTFISNTTEDTVTEPKSEILISETIPVTDELISSPKEKIQASVSNMTLEQKIGQMFFLAFRQDEAGKDITKINDNIKQVINDYCIGGVILFSENIRNEEQVTQYISDLQQTSYIPLFIGIDEEGGRVLRTNKLDVPRIPPAFETGKTGDPQNAYNNAQTIAGYLKPLGFNVDFAPSADVFTNPDNTVIGDRAFSSDPNKAAEMVKYFTKGLLDNGVLPTVKHFPGHGNTVADSHYGIAVTNKTLEELEACEFIPFQAGIDAGTVFVMAGHISAPNADLYGSILPAEFSGFLLHDILREQLGFKGIIITDALNMGAISLYYTSEETAVKSVLAGVDMLLMPENFKEAYDGLIKAVKSGEITEERINESVARILTAKYNAGLIEFTD